MEITDDLRKTAEGPVTELSTDTQICETTPLLGSRESHGDCDSCPETSNEDAWKPPRGFWWIEVGTFRTPGPPS